MKFRDVVLLLVGGGLVVVGMLMSNLIETDAIADSHGSKLVEYEYKVVLVERIIREGRNVQSQQV